MRMETAKMDVLGMKIIGEGPRVVSKWILGWMVFEKKRWNQSE
jgi:hypothetical protein